MLTSSITRTSFCFHTHFLASEKSGGCLSGSAGYLAYRQNASRATDLCRCTPRGTRDLKKMWLASRRKDPFQGLDNPGLARTAWAADVLEMLTRRFGICRVSVQEPAHQLKSPHLQRVEGFLRGGGAS
uniref:Uncharacterized protein n=1 Tax=Bionectria ochroleuca TaxID=29856 RepID=A0A8H7N0S7_BIOOC